MDIFSQISKDYKDTRKSIQKKYENFQKGAVKEAVNFYLAILIDVSKGDGIKSALFTAPFVLVVLLSFFLAARAIVTPFM